MFRVPALKELEGVDAEPLGKKIWKYERFVHKQRILIVNTNLSDPSEKIFMIEYQIGPEVLNSIIEGVSTIEEALKKYAKTMHSSLIEMKKKIDTQRFRANSAPPPGFDIQGPDRGIITP